VSILNIQPSEEILIRENKEYRKQVRNRLKEIVADKEENEFDRASASRMLDEYFPALTWKQKEEHIKNYDSIVLGRRAETIPVMICKTCGRVCDRVREYQDTMPLIREKRKTWKRIIKPNLNIPMISIDNRKLRVRRIFVAYPMIECIRRKHKLTIKFRAKTIKEMGYAYK